MFKKQYKRRILVLLNTTSLFCEQENNIHEIYKTSFIQSPYSNVQPTFDKSNTNKIIIPSVNSQNNNNKNILQTAEQLKNKNNKYTSSHFKKSAFLGGIT